MSSRHLHTPASTVSSRGRMPTSASFIPHRQRRLFHYELSAHTDVDRRHPWHLNERFVFLALGSCLMGLWDACTELCFDRLKPVWPAKRVSQSKVLESGAERQMAFGRAVWSTLAARLEQLFDFSTTLGVMHTQTGNILFIIAYYALNKWAWRQILWLSFGSLR